MSKKERMQYFILTSVMFVVGFLIYGFMSSNLQKEVGIPLTPLTCFAVFGILGGTMLAGLISGIILFTNFIKKQKICFKVFCIILFPITIALICFFGILLFIPYFIYNITQIRKKKYTDVSV